MKAKEYQVMERAIEEGINHGYYRAYKHVDNPSEDQIKLEIFNSVLTSICEWFDFPEN